MFMAAALLLFNSMVISSRKGAFNNVKIYKEEN